MYIFMTSIQYLFFPFRVYTKTIFRFFQRKLFTKKRYIRVHVDQRFDNRLDASKSRVEGREYLSSPCFCCSADSKTCSWDFYIEAIHLVSSYGNGKAVRAISFQEHVQKLTLFNLRNKTSELEPASCGSCVSNVFSLMWFMWYKKNVNKKK